MTAAMIKPRAARPYIRGQALKERQAQTHAELRRYVEAQKAMQEILARDPHRALREQFSNMSPGNSGRAMAAQIVADTKADLFDMDALEKAIGEAVEDDLAIYAEWPELGDVAFLRDAGLVA